MPVFKKNDYGHCYIVGPPYPGAGIVTYQISRGGVAFLEERGVNSGDRVPDHLFDKLRSKKCIWTGGGGSPEQPELEFLPENRHLDPLIKWAITGDTSSLPGALRDSNVTLAELITPGFVNLLKSFARGIELTEAARIGFGEFDEHLQRKAVAELHGVSSALSGSADGRRVLWQVGKLCGYVAAYVRAGSQPPGWRDTIYAQIFALVSTVVEPREPHPRVPASFRPLLPHVFWKVDNQEVLAVLESHPFPNARALTWSVNGAQVAPLCRTEAGTGWIEESRSPALSPEDWSFELTYQALGGETVRLEKTLQLAPEQLFALFDQSGRAISWTEGNLLPLGHYLLLVSPQIDLVELQETAGFSLESLDFPPVGWWNWHGFAVHVKAESTIGSYRFGDVDLTLSWELSKPGPVPIDFTDQVPYYLDSWPTIYLNCSSLPMLEGALLQVEQVSSGKRTTLRLETEASGSRSALSIVGNISGYAASCDSPPFEEMGSGRYLLRLLPALRLDREPDALEFVAMQGIRLGYQADSARPESATCIWVSGAQVVVPRTGCQVKRDERTGLLLVAASDSVREPVVQFGLASRPDVSVVWLTARLRVSRAAYISSQDRIGSWQPLPIPLDLADLGPEAFLKLELVEEPLVSNRELVSRLVGGSPLFAGKAVSSRRQFEVPLHRWRDGFGIKAGGEVQVQCGGGWISIARLAGEPRKTIFVEPPPRPVEDIFARLEVFESWLLQKDQSCAEAAIEDFLERCIGVDEWQNQLVVVRLARLALFFGLIQKARHLLAIAKAGSRLPDLDHVRALVDLRAGTFDPSALLTLERAVDEWPESPQRHLALAEISYRIGRIGRGGRGALRCCRDRASSVAAVLAVERCEAMILFGLSTILLGEDLTLQVGSAHEPAAVLVGISKYLRKPLNERVSVPRCDWWPTIVHDLDRCFLKAISAQANGSAAESQKDLDMIRSNALFFPGKNLVFARQERLRGRPGEARRLYEAALASHDSDWEIALQELMTI